MARYCGGGCHVAVFVHDYMHGYHPARVRGKGNLRVDGRGLADGLAVQDSAGDDYFRWDGEGHRGGFRVSVKYDRALEAPERSGGDADEEGQQGGDEAKGEVAHLFTPFKTVPGRGAFTKESRQGRADSQTSSVSAASTGRRALRASTEPGAGGRKKG